MLEPVIVTATVTVLLQAVKLTYWPWAAHGQQDQQLAQLNSAMPLPVHCLHAINGLPQLISIIL
jgi:hypothetical protein